jgi:hypothetical protein
VLSAQGVIAAKPRTLAQGLIACLFIVGGCQRSHSTTEPQDTAQTSRPSAALEVLVPAEVDVLDPRIASDAFSVRASRLVHAGLFRLNPNTLAPEPNLAASFQWETPLRLRVQLRRGIFFRTGEELQASDVAASLAAFASEGSRQRRVVEAISGTEVLSSHEIVVILRETHATLLSDLELPILRAADAQKPPRAPGDDVPGLGPYDCKLHVPGLLELAPASGLRAPKSARTLVIRTIRDENARAMRLLSGRAHVASSVLSPTTVRAVEKAGLTIKKRPGANTAYLLIRHEGVLKDVSVRRAIAEAIDRTSLTDGLFEGTATPAATHNASAPCTRARKSSSDHSSAGDPRPRVYAADLDRPPAQLGCARRRESIGRCRATHRASFAGTWNAARTAQCRQLRTGDFADSRVHRTELDEDVLAQGSAATSWAQSRTLQRCVTESVARRSRAGNGRNRATAPLSACRRTDPQRMALDSSLARRSGGCPGQQRYLLFAERRRASWGFGRAVAIETVLHPFASSMRQVSRARLHLAWKFLSRLHKCADAVCYFFGQRAFPRLAHARAC